MPNVQPEPDQHPPPTAFTFVYCVPCAALAEVVVGRRRSGNNVWYTTFSCSGAQCGRNVLFTVYLCAGDPYILM